MPMNMQYELNCFFEDNVNLHTYTNSLVTKYNVTVNLTNKDL